MPINIEPHENDIETPIESFLNSIDWPNAYGNKALPSAVTLYQPIPVWSLDKSFQGTKNEFLEFASLESPSLIGWRTLVLANRRWSHVDSRIADNSSMILNYSISFHKDGKRFLAAAEFAEKASGKDVYALRILESYARRGSFLWLYNVTKPSLLIPLFNWKNRHDIRLFNVSQLGLASVTKSIQMPPAIDDLGG